MCESWGNKENLQKKKGSLLCKLKEKKWGSLLKIYSIRVSRMELWWFPN